MPFESPNHTTTPNDLFDSLMADMEESELKVTLAVIRGTLGYHKESFKCSLVKLGIMTGLSENAVIAGADAAEKRGTIERVKDGLKTTEWRVKFSTSASEVMNKRRKKSTSASEVSLPQPVRQPTSASEGQLRVKESIKKSKEKESTAPKTGASVFEIAKVLSELCGMEFDPNKGQLLREAKSLMTASLPVTPELLRANYNGHGYWSENDWRGKKGQRPTPSQIRQTWGAWVNKSKSQPETNSAAVDDLRRRLQEHKRATANTR